MITELIQCLETHGREKELINLQKNVFFSLYHAHGWRFFAWPISYEANLQLFMRKNFHLHQRGKRNIVRVIRKIFLTGPPRK